MKLAAKSSHRETSVYDVMKCHHYTEVNGNQMYKPPSCPPPLKKKPNIFLLLHLSHLWIT